MPLKSVTCSSAHSLVFHQSIPLTFPLLCCLFVYQSLLLEYEFESGCNPETESVSEWKSASESVSEFESDSKSNDCLIPNWNLNSNLRVNLYCNLKLNMIGHLDLDWNLKMTLNPNCIMAESDYEFEFES